MTSISRSFVFLSALSALMLSAGCGSDGKGNECIAPVNYYPDGDGDNYGDATATPAYVCVPEKGFITKTGDCNDDDEKVNPRATEECDGIDNDCNNAVDDGVGNTYYGDGDGDGYGNDAVTQTGCTRPTGYVDQGGDCDDTDELVNPGAAEFCDEMDNNCDGTPDNGLPATTYYPDDDGDGYGNDTGARTSCSELVGYATVGGDCDDDNAASNPGAAEWCDGSDNDCDGTPDNGVTNTYYADNDSDTYGNGTQTTTGCSAPSGYVGNQDDCNDADGEVKPGATELCDTFDNNCNGSADEGVTNTYYPDSDADGYGEEFGLAMTGCAAPSGYVDNQRDCNDSNGSVNPGTAELCDGVDNNCDYMTDEGVSSTYYADQDADGYGDAGTSMSACSAPSGYVSDSGDCNDNDGSVKPGATELCDGVDNDCNSSADDGLPTSTYYADGDSDGYGDSATTMTGCAAPSGYDPDSGDCDESNPSINPGAAEVCDGVDNNCDGSPDDGGVCIEVCDDGLDNDNDILADCDDSDCAADAACTSGATSKLVFVLTGGYRGADIGGVPGADRACQTEATNYGLSGTFMAWLSDSVSSPSTRFTPSSVPYLLASGTEVAADWADLTDGTISTAIIESIDGTNIGGFPAWTGTATDGTASANNCSGWTTNSSAYSGDNGYTGYTGSGWTTGTTVCGNYAVIYCFEQ